MVNIRTRDFGKDEAPSRIDTSAVEAIVNGLSTQIQNVAEEVKSRIPADRKVTRWNFDVQRDKDGRLSGISAEAAEFG